MTDSQVSDMNLSSEAPQKDANDYTRFDDISSDSDTETETKLSPTAVKEKVQEAGLAKEEGNSHFKAGRNQEACSAYSKGLKTLDDLQKKGPIPSPERVVARELQLSLLLNSAMASLKMEKFKDAITSSSKALKMDESNVKALFRRGVAYSRSHDYEKAKVDLLAVLKLDESNTAAKKELSALKKLIQEHRAANKKQFGNLFERAGGVYDDKEEQRRQKEEAKRLKEESERLEYERECEERKREGNEEEITFKEWKKQKEEKKKKAKEEREAAQRLKEEEARQRRLNEKKAEDKKEEVEYDEEDEELMKDLKKGYCYFRRDQSHEEKSLIGDIAPKKVAEVSSEAQAKKASAWNAEGTTWEERDCTDWAQECVETHLLAASGCDGVSVTKVNKVDGEASVAIVRGTPRYIFDFSVELTYEVLIADAKYSGKINMHDVGSDDTPEIQIEQSKEPPPHHAFLIKERILSLQEDILNKAIPAFVEEFRSTH